MGALISITWAQARAWRARSHQLHRRASRKQMLPVASRLCGVQAQVTSAAALALWSRVEGITPDVVQRALWKDRSLVKLWTIRGTLHLIPAVDYRLWQAALESWDQYRHPTWLKNFGITHEKMARIVDAVAKALDGATLTRTELADRVATITESPEMGDAIRESWGSLLKPANCLGHVCFGPARGQQVRFTNPASWLGESTAVGGEAAVVETARRYFTLNAPASRDDFTHFFGLRVKQAEHAIRALGEWLVEVDVEGRRALVPARDLRRISKVEPNAPVRLLPAFDQYVLSASRHVSHLLPDRVPRSEIFRPQGWITPVLLVDGRIEGVWSYVKHPRRLQVSVQPFRKQAKAIRAAAEEEANRLGEFFDLPVEWAWP